MKALSDPGYFHKVTRILWILDEQVIVVEVKLANDYRHLEPRLYIQASRVNSKHCYLHWGDLRHEFSVPSMQNNVYCEHRSRNFIPISPYGRGGQVPFTTSLARQRAPHREFIYPNCGVIRQLYLKWQLILLRGLPHSALEAGGNALAWEAEAACR
jgi:hypothetical protein